MLAGPNQLPVMIFIKKLFHNGTIEDDRDALVLNVLCRLVQHNRETWTGCEAPADHALGVSLDVLYAELPVTMDGPYSALRPALTIAQTVQSLDRLQRQYHYIRNDAGQAANQWENIYLHPHLIGRLQKALAKVSRRHGIVAVRPWLTPPPKQTRHSMYAYSIAHDLALLARYSKKPPRPTCAFQLEVPIPPDERAVTRLLTISLTAEYALRLSMVDPATAVGANGGFRAAYDSTLFSARAYLAVRGIHLSNRDEVFATLGDPNWSQTLRRLLTATTTLETNRISPAEVATVFADLMVVTRQVNARHEAYIFHVLGAGARGRFFASLPTYLHDAYVDWQTDTLSPTPV